MRSKIVDMLHAKGNRLGLAVSGTFELTPRCNFNCPMCYVRLSLEEQRRRGRELTADEWIGLAEDAKRNGMVFLLLTGGEPTLRPDFCEIYRNINAMGFRISINTNGRLLTGETMELLKQMPPYRVNITLYGTSNEDYEKQCGEPAFDRVTAHIRELREAGIHLRTTISLSKGNAQEQQRLYEIAKELGASVQETAYMFPPVRKNPTAFGDNYRINPEEAGHLLFEIDREEMDPETFRKRAEYIAANQEVEPRTVEECGEGGRVFCRAGSTSFWLNWDGTMTACGLMPQPSFDVKTLGFDSAWSRLRQAVAEIRLPAKCTECPHRRLCHPCAAKCYAESGSFTQVPDYVCRYTHAYVDEMTRFWKEQGNAD